MSIELKKNCKYSLVVPTSMGVRITPVNNQPVHNSEMFMMQTTSAETNVASIASYLGLGVKVLTTFVEDFVGLGVLLVVFLGFYLKSTNKTVGDFVKEVNE